VAPQRAFFCYTTMDSSNIIAGHTPVPAGDAAFASRFFLAV